MKLLLVSFENPNAVGVTQKLGTQVAYLANINKVNVQGLMVHNAPVKFDLPLNWTQLTFKTSKLPNVFYRRFFRRFIPFLMFIKNRRERLRAFDLWLESNVVDVVYMRYPTADYFLYKLLKKHKHITWVFEHNTIEIPEMELNKNKWEDGKLVLRSEKMFAKKCLQLANGIVGVTNEIVQYELKRIGNNKPSFVIGNAIDNQQIVAKKSVKRDLYRGVFLIGSYNDWHGIDLLPNLIAQERNRLHITVVGEVPTEVMKPLESNNITFASAINATEIDEYLGSFDFGIGTLALDRKNMKEAVSLKTRTYLKNGLPVLLDYDDTDLKAVKGVFKWNKQKNQIQKLLQYLDQEQSISIDEIASAIGAEKKMKNLYEFITKLNF